MEKFESVLAEFEVDDDVPQGFDARDEDVEALLQSIPPEVF